MDRNKARKIVDWLNEQMKNMPDDLKVSGKTGRGTFTDSNFTLKVEFSDVTEDGKVMSKQIVDYNDLCESFGLRKEWLGKCFYMNGDTFRVAGLSPRSYKRPILADNVKNGKTYKFTADSVRSKIIAVD